MELTDEYTINLRALKTLAQPVDFWDSIIICVVTSRLPSDTIGQWELTLGECEVPTLQKLTQFLKSRARILQKIESNASNYDSNNRNYNSTINKTNSNSSSSKSQSSGTKFTRPVTTFVSTDGQKCSVCGNDHRLYACDKFKEFSVTDRRLAVKKLNLCFNCLNSNHYTQQCMSRSCTKCNRKHNTLLHIDEDSGNTLNLSTLSYSSPCSHPVSTAVGFCKAIAMAIASFSPYSYFVRRFA